MITRIKCWLGYHDEELCQASIVYKLVDGNGLINAHFINLVNQGLNLTPIKKSYFRCKLCKKERVTTND